MSYRPLPPMMPIRTCSILFGSGLWALGFRLSALGVARLAFRSLQHLLDEPLPLRVLADVAGGYARVVLKENQVFAIDRLANESPLEGQRLHREQVVAHHPWVLQMRDRRDHVRD